jgi:penicillin amidase
MHWLFSHFETLSKLRLPRAIFFQSAENSCFLLDFLNGRLCPSYLREFSFDEKPHSENPVSGIIVSANFRPFGFKANQRGDWQPDDRFNTIYTLLSKKEKWSVEETKELQTLSMNLDNKNMLQELLKDIDTSAGNQKYLDILKHWR